MQNTGYKRMFGLAILGLGLTMNCSFTHTKSDRAVIVKNLNAEYLEGCETGRGDCNPVEIERQSSTDSVLLVFPNGGTETEVYLGAANSNEVYLSSKKMTGEDPPKLSLGNLKDGEYKAGIRSCGLGAIFKVKLRTGTK